MQDIGFGRLCVASEALHTVIAAGSWPIKKLLEGLFKFINNSPAKRVEYLRVSLSSFYPEKLSTMKFLLVVPLISGRIFLS